MVRSSREEMRNWRHGIWQEFWPEVPRMNLVSRRIDLDTRLQVELGKILSDYLREGDEDERVSLETIARLVLLAYYVGRLIYQDNEGVEVSLTGRIPTVRTIRDKLRYARLHRAESFRGKRASKRKRRN